MGADLLLLALPKAKLTPQRKKELDAVIDKLTLEDDAVTFFIDQENLAEPEEDDLLAQVKGRVRAAVDAYEKFDDLRDVTFVSLAPNMHHYICGGISWGDSPTESFDSFRTLGTFSAVWDLLEKWAKADSLKAGRLYERFQRWCEQHADDIDAVRYGSASLYGRIISVIESTGAVIPEEVRDQLDQIAQTIVDENKKP
jgi:hypothetical protein